jgi:glycine/D-amino acid oxidase-like deaminating enzyme
MRNNQQGDSPQRVAIIGGGLAGLSTAYHLLQKSPSSIEITIIDKALPGAAGASSVAGG